jgi:hypothetical protein
MTANIPAKRRRQAKNPFRYFPDPRRRHLVSRLHALGPRVLSCFLAEVENGASVEERLERYAVIDADDLIASGGDRFPPLLRVIKGGVG